MVHLLLSAEIRMKLKAFIAVTCIVICIQSDFVHGQTSESTPTGCFKNGKHFSVGETISSAQNGNRCFGTICGDGGHVINWENFNCKSSTSSSPPSTSSTTQYSSSPSPTPTTTKHGCFHQGKYFAPGTEIEKGEDKNSNWCYGVLCSNYGEVYYWDDFNCFKTSTTRLTTYPTPSSTSSTSSTTTSTSHSPSTPLSTSTTSSTPTTSVALTTSTESSVRGKSNIQRLSSKLLKLLRNRLRPK